MHQAGKYPEEILVIVHISLSNIYFETLFFMLLVTNNNK